MNLIAQLILTGIISVQTNVINQSYLNQISLMDKDNKDFTTMQPETINISSRVLHIGDSHTAGVYGKELDSLMRSTEAKVQTYGSSGASPSWWINGNITKSGFYSKDDKGNIDSPANWQEPHLTPILSELIKSFRPNVIIISLGANLVKAKAENIENEVKKICDIAKESGAKIIWVGPPNGREDKKPTNLQNFLYEHIQKVALQYGDFIDSRPYTKYPASGKDGIHYGGEEGAKIAKEWAYQVFKEIQELD